MYQFIHFENWTSDLTTSTLTSKGLSHVEKVIKVFATEFDPRAAYKKPSLLVFPIFDNDFTIAELFDYDARGSYTGLELETELKSLKLDDSGKRIVRALFRFANKPEMGFCQRAMQTRSRDGNWLIDHPINDIDGIWRAENNPQKQSLIHLDIFLPESIATLTTLVDFENEGQLLTAKEGTIFRVNREQSIASLEKR